MVARNKTMSKAELDALAEQWLLWKDDPTKQNYKIMKLFKVEINSDGSRIVYKKDSDGIYHKCLTNDQDNEQALYDFSVDYGAKHDCFNQDKIARAAIKNFGATTVDMFKNCIKGDVWKAVKKAIEGMCVRVCTVIKSSVSHLTQPLVNFVFSF